jgi:hypothetical protein
VAGRKRVARPAAGMTALTARPRPETEPAGAGTLSDMLARLIADGSSGWVWPNRRAAGDHPWCPVAAASRQANARLNALLILEGTVGS